MDEGGPGSQEIDTSWGFYQHIVQYLQSNSAGSYFVSYTVETRTLACYSSSEDAQTFERKLDLHQAIALCGECGADEGRSYRKWLWPETPDHIPHTFMPATFEPTKPGPVKKQKRK